MNYFKKISFKSLFENKRTIFCSKQSKNFTQKLLKSSIRKKKPKTQTISFSFKNHFSIKNPLSSVCAAPRAGECPRGEGDLAGNFPCGGWGETPWKGGGCGWCPEGGEFPAGRGGGRNGGSPGNFHPSSPRPASPGIL